MKRTCLLFSLVLLGASCLPGLGRLEAQWKPLQAGFDYQNSPDFFRIDPRRFKIDLSLASDYGKQALTAQEYQKRSRAWLVVNGGFFDEFLRSLGLLYRQGKTLNPLRNAPWGIFLIKRREGPSIISRGLWRPENVSMAIQVGPRLVIDGQIPSFKESGVSPRSGIGITREGLVEIGVSQEPLTLRQWAERFQKDCSQALNLDGGGSSQITVSLPNFSLNVEGLTAVPNAVAVFRID